MNHDRCQKCQKQPATVHLTEIVNQEKREAHLCEGCAKSAGVNINLNFTIPEILGKFVEGRPGREGTDRKCPRCGIRYSDFRTKARLGCAYDYEVFQSGIVPLLEKVHGSSQHVGKVPQTVESVIRKENELVQLKRELDGLVRSEKFEKAAQVRDKIRTLEGELGITS